MERLSCFSQFQLTAFSLYNWTKKSFSKIPHSVVIFWQNRQNLEVIGVDLPPTSQLKLVLKHLSSHHISHSLSWSVNTIKNIKVWKQVIEILVSQTLCRVLALNINENKPMNLHSWMKDKNLHHLISWTGSFWIICFSLLFLDDLGSNIQQMISSVKNFMLLSSRLRQPTTIFYWREKYLREQETTK